MRTTQSQADRGGVPGGVSGQRDISDSSTAKLGVGTWDKQCKPSKLGQICLRLLFGIKDVQAVLRAHHTD